MGCRAVVWGLPCVQSRRVVLCASLAEGWRLVARLELSGGRLELGAWTKMRLRAMRCEVTPDAEFWRYVASDRRRASPFDGASGGGVAIARPPWLAALTDIQPASVAGGGASRHALHPDEQSALWSLFPPREVGWWWDRQQPGWRVLEERAWPDVAYVLPIARNRMRRVLVQPARAPGAAALVCMADDVRRGVIPHAHEQRSYALWWQAGAKLPGAEALLEGVRWAWMEPDSGRLVTADERGVVTLWKPPNAPSPGGALIAIRAHDLCALTPTPKAAPAWARAGLPASDGGPQRPFVRPRRGRAAR